MDLKFLGISIFVEFGAGLTSYLFLGCAGIIGFFPKHLHLFNFNFSRSASSTSAGRWGGFLNFGFKVVGN